MKSGRESLREKFRNQVLSRDPLHRHERRRWLRQPWWFVAVVVGGGFSEWLLISAYLAGIAGQSLLIPSTIRAIELYEWLGIAVTWRLTVSEAKSPRGQELYLTTVASRSLFEVAYIPLTLWLISAVAIAHTGAGLALNTRYAPVTVAFKGVLIEAPRHFLQASVEILSIPVVVWTAMIVLRRLRHSLAAPLLAAALLYVIPNAYVLVYGPLRWAGRMALNASKDAEYWRLQYQLLRTLSEPARTLFTYLWIYAPMLAFAALVTALFSLYVAPRFKRLYADPH